MHNSQTASNNCTLTTSMPQQLNLPSLEVIWWYLWLTWLVQRPLMIGVDHDVTVPTLLSTVSPWVTTAPIVIALGAAELSPYSALALVWGFLRLWKHKRSIHCWGAISTPYPAWHNDISSAQHYTNLKPKLRATIKLSEPGVYLPQLITDNKQANDRTWVFTFRRILRQWPNSTHLFNISWVLVNYDCVHNSSVHMQLRVYTSQELQFSLTKAIIAPTTIRFTSSQKYELAYIVESWCSPLGFWKLDTSMTSPYPETMNIIYCTTVDTEVSFTSTVWTPANGTYLITSAVQCWAWERLKQGTQRSWHVLCRSLIWKPREFRYIYVYGEPHILLIVRNVMHRARENFESSSTTKQKDERYAYTVDSQPSA